MSEAEAETEGVEPDDAAEVKGFDPATDPATSPNRLRIKDTYERAVNRGNDGFAERLRREPSQRKQLQIAGQAREFDPAHDDTPTSSKLRVAGTWQQLREAGHDEAAEELRYGDTLAEQKALVREFRAEYDLDAEE